MILTTGLTVVFTVMLTYSRILNNCTRFDALTPAEVLATIKNSISYGFIGRSHNWSKSNKMVPFMSSMNMKFLNGAKSSISREYSETEQLGELLSNIS